MGAARRVASTTVGRIRLSTFQKMYEAHEHTLLEATSVGRCEASWSGRVKGRRIAGNDTIDDRPECASDAVKMFNLVRDPGIEHLIKVCNIQFISVGRWGGRRNAA
jgi:hypothetical protein